MRTKGKGFTLIELLVVIAIIAILAAILFPIFSGAKERGRQAKCLNNLKQLTEAIQQYVDDYSGVMPSSCATQSSPHLEWSGSPLVGRMIDASKGQIWRYTHSAEIYLCPTDKGAKALGISQSYSGGALAKTPPTDYGLSYSMNQQVGSVYNSRPRGGKYASGKYEEFKLEAATAGKSSKIFMLIHESRETINDGWNGWSKDGSGDQQSKIHYDGTTLSYCDGHVKWISWVSFYVAARGISGKPGTGDYDTYPIDQ